VAVAEAVVVIIILVLLVQAELVELVVEREVTVRMAVVTLLQILEAEVVELLDMVILVEMARAVTV
jgi:hypothetical protein